MHKEPTATYIRVSTDDQLEYSPQVQQEELLAYAKEHHLFISPDHIFIDDGISGRNAEKRPSFMAMIRAARKHEFTTILVHKFDRFARNREDSVLYKAMLKKEGVKVISIKEPIPDDDKFAVIYESMLEAMAEYYSLNLAEEVKKTMKKKAELGQWQSTAPFGYRVEQGKLVPIPEEANLVAYIFDQYANHQRPAIQLAKELNAMGIRTHRGNLFDNRGIGYILQNPVYCGYTRWTPTGKIRRNFNHPDAIIAKGTHKSIITEELFAKAKERFLLQQKKHTYHGRPSTEKKHWLSGIVKCSNCGSSLVIYRNYKNGDFSMQCGNYNHGVCTVSHSVTSKKLSSAIISALDTISSQSDIGQLSIQFTKVKKEDADLSVTQALYQRTKQMLTKAKEAYLAGIDSLEEYGAIKKQLEEELLQLEEKLKVSQEKEISPLQNPAFLQRLRDTKEILCSKTASMEEQKESVAEVIEKVIYHKETNQLQLFLYTF